MSKIEELERQIIKLQSIIPLGEEKLQECIDSYAKEFFKQIKRKKLNLVGQLVLGDRPNYKGWLAHELEEMWQTFACNKQDLMEIQTRVREARAALFKINAEHKELVQRSALTTSNSMKVKQKPIQPMKVHQYTGSSMLTYPWERVIK